MNVKKSCSCHNIKIVISISTDKAVDPYNMMGLTKAIQERYLVLTIFKKRKMDEVYHVRFGNVIGTNESFSNFVSPSFK